MSGPKSRPQSNPDTSVRSIDGILVNHDTLIESEIAAQKSWRIPTKYLMLSGFSILVVVSGVILLFTRSSNALPAQFVKNAGFPLYFPSPMVEGYGYQTGSAKMEDGLALYTLKNGANTIIVSEQVAPANPPNLTQLIGFTSLRTVAGNAVVGTSSTKQPLVIIVSNTTLITMTGNNSLPSDVVATLAQNMRSL